MAYCIVADRNPHRGHGKSKLKARVNKRADRFRKDLRKSGVQFIEVYIPPNTDRIPLSLAEKLPVGFLDRYFIEQALTVFTWEEQHGFFKVKKGA